jgi:hypothetical protein
MPTDLLLLSGNDIPFAEAQVSIHQPTLKEVAYIGEECFFTGYQMLKVNKNNIKTEGKNNLDDLTNFDILIAILKERNAVMQKNRNCVFMVLSLLFPSYAITINKEGIVLKKEENEEKHIIDKVNFDIFQRILLEMFAFDKQEDAKEEFNPDGQMASRIAEKIRKRHEKLAQIKGNSTKIDIISRYASILAIGLQINLTDVMNYTVYQLFDQQRRMQLKTQYDITISARLAGAKDVEDPQDWMADIH